MFTPDHMANVVDLDSANMAAMGPARGEPDHVVGVPFGDPDNSPQWGRLVESRITARASAVEVLVQTPQWGRLVERVRLSEGWAFSGCFGHAVRPRLGMLAGS